MANVFASRQLTLKMWKGELMSKFNTYTKRLLSAAKEYRGEMQKLDEAVKANKQLRDAGIADVWNDEFKSRAADVFTAPVNLKYQERQKEIAKRAEDARKAFFNQCDGIRNEFIDALSDANTLKSDMVNSDMLSLLSSGFMSYRDYRAMADEAEAAGNVFMMRMIGKYAMNADVKDITERQKLSALADELTGVESGYEKGFDTVATAIRMYAGEASIERKTALVDDSGIDRYTMSMLGHLDDEDIEAAANDF